MTKEEKMAYLNNRIKNIYKNEKNFKKLVNARTYDKTIAEKLGEIKWQN